MSRSESAALEIIRHRLASVAESMGSALVRASRSPNIKERGDLSCAVFGADGQLVAQAAHIPVHLGALTAAVDSARRSMPVWEEGDVVVLNDPYAGGSHLPDLTTVSAVFLPEAGHKQPTSVSLEQPSFFLATRAHHADIGGATPGSLSMVRDLFGEGLILPPVLLARKGAMSADVSRIIYANSRTPDERRGDLEAQVAAHSVGSERLFDVASKSKNLRAECDALIEWSDRLARSRLRRLPDGVYLGEDQIDDDGLGGGPFPIRVAVTVRDGTLSVDFSGTADQADGGVNAPMAVTRSAVAYVVACLVGDGPINAGTFRGLQVHAPPGCLLAPNHPAPVVAGNVETSQRIVDVLLSALSSAAPNEIPACSQGTMNNVLAGSSHSRPPWAYYETIGGGMGASAGGSGASGLQVHMTNTKNTPIEALEIECPLRVEEYGLRRGSGGKGSNRGGDGIIRSYRFLAPATVSLVGERRTSQPPGAVGGLPGSSGINLLRSAGQSPVELPAKGTFQVGPGDVLELRTPGGGGWGSPRP